MTTGEHDDRSPEREDSRCLQCAIHVRLDGAGGSVYEGKRCLALPSGGDTSYPGLVWHDNLLWMTYYASHEGKANIYLARIRFNP